MDSDSEVEVELTDQWKPDRFKERASAVVDIATVDVDNVVAVAAFVGCLLMEIRPLFLELAVDGPKRLPRRH